MELFDFIISCGDGGNGHTYIVGFSSTKQRLHGMLFDLC
jgi:hypothetical protein